MEKLNRFKEDVAQTNKWLSEQMGKDPVTISKWCTDTTQPQLEADYSKVVQLKKFQFVLMKAMPEAVRWRKKLKLCLGFRVQKIILRKKVVFMVSPKSPMDLKMMIQL